MLEIPEPLLWALAYLACRLESQAQKEAVATAEKGIKADNTNTPELNIPLNARMEEKSGLFALYEGSFVVQRRVFISCPRRIDERIQKYRLYFFLLCCRRRSGCRVPACIPAGTQYSLLVRNTKGEMAMQDVRTVLKCPSERSSSFRFDRNSSLSNFLRDRILEAAQDCYWL